MKTRVTEHYHRDEPYWQVEYRTLFGWRPLEDHRGVPRSFSLQENAVRVAADVARTGKVTATVVWESGAPRA